MKIVGFTKVEEATETIFICSSKINYNYCIILLLVLLTSNNTELATHDDNKLLITNNFQDRY